MVVVQVEGVMEKNKERPLVALLDSGSTHTWIQKGLLGQSVTTTKMEEVTSQTLGGTIKGLETMTIKSMTLPELFKTRHITELNVKVFETDCRYDDNRKRYFTTTRNGIRL